MADTTITLLRDLIAIDSMNPSLVPGASGENEIGGAIATKLHSGGLDVQIQQVAPGRIEEHWTAAQCCGRHTDGRPIEPERGGSQMHGGSRRP